MDAVYYHWKSLDHYIFLCSISATPVRLKELMDALYHSVANKWKLLGIQLEIPKDVLATIEKRKMGDPRQCLLEMLEWWLKRMDPPASWSAIAEAVEFLGKEQLARELRLKYCSSGKNANG